MPNNNKPRIARCISKFTRTDIKQRLAKAKLICRHLGLDIKAAPHTQYVQGDNCIGRILIITPKKIGNAPKRNKIRRRLKAIFYQEKFYKLPYDFIIYCKKQSTSLSFPCINSIMYQAREILLKNI